MEQGRLSGPAAIVTGASKGIGKAIALSFTVIATAARPKPLRQSPGRCGLPVRKHSLTAIHARVRLVVLEPAMWRSAPDVNITGVALLSPAIPGGMLEHGYGKIISISSIGGRKGGWGRSAYRVSKARLISLAETLAAEVRKYGVNVYCICPSATDTEGYRAAFHSRGREGPGDDAAGGDRRGAPVPVIRRELGHHRHRHRCVRQLEPAVRLGSQQVAVRLTMGTWKESHS